MIKDFTTYINEGLFDRNQSEFNIRKTDKGIEQIYIPKNKNELYEYIELDIEQAKKEGTYPDVNLNNIDVSELGDNGLWGLFGGDNMYKKIYPDIPNLNINPDISNWDIKYIPSNFFDCNKQIKEFTIPNSVTSIGNRAFASCIGLTSITIPNSVTSMGIGVFSYCAGLTYIEIPNSVTVIENSAFRGCSGLKSVAIPDSVKSIGKWAFDYCRSLTSVTIPDSVESIECFAFDHCNNLTSVTIPKNCIIDANSFPKKCKVTRKR